MNKYLLSTGRSTYLVEYYIMDLIKLYLSVFPGDVPGASNFGFDFNIGNITRADLPKEVSRAVHSLVDAVKRDFNKGIDISIDGIDIIDETKVKVTITINRNLSEDITINLYN